MKEATARTAETLERESYTLINKNQSIKNALLSIYNRRVINLPVFFV